MLTQEENERRQAELGKARSRRQVEMATSRSYVGDTAVGRRLVSEAAGALAQDIRWFYEHETRPGRRGPVGRVLKWALEAIDELGADTIALTAVRCCLNMAWLRDVEAHKIANRIGTELSEEAFLRDVHGTERTKFNRAMLRAKKARNRARKRGEVFRVLRQDDVTYTAWPRDKRIGVGLLFLETVRQRSDLFTFQVRRTQGRPLTFVHLTDTARRWFAKAQEKYEWLHPVYLPMVEPPRDWESVYDGGHLTDNSRRRFFCRPRPGVGLSLYEEGLGPVLDAASELQRTPYRVDEEALEAVRYLVETDPERLGLSDERLIRKAALDCHLAGEYAGRSLWFTHFADFRGRLYPLSSHLQPQSWHIARGLLNFAEAAPINDAKAEWWYRVHGANVWGQDKATFDERIEWTHKNEGMLLDVARDPLECQEWTKADKPTVALSWALEFARFLEHGYGFESRHPVSMDGTNNGLQILSLLLRDPVGARATNCIPLDAPQDIYSLVAEALHQRLLLYRDDKIINPKEPVEIQMTGTEAAQAWLRYFQGVPPRALAKRPAMTKSYSVSHYAVHGYVKDWYLEFSKKEGRKVVDHDPYPCTTILANLLWHSVDDVVIAGKTAMEWLKAVAALCCKHNIAPQWISPSGFPVRQDYRKKEKAVVKFMLRGETYQTERHFPHIRADAETADSLNSRKHINGISPNFVHSLDAAMVHLTLLEGKGRVRAWRMVHDDYATHAANADFLAQTLRRVAVRMFSDDLLADFRDQIQALLPAGVDLPDLPEYGDLDVSELERADYFFA